jgi:hypothetical protein
MEERMSITKSIMDAVVEFIAKRKVNQLEKAFRSNEKLVGHIRDMYKAYDAIEKNIDDFCKKYPQDCADAEAKRKKFRV